MDSRLPWRSGKARRHSRRPNRLLPICRTPTFELFQNTKPQNPLKRGALWFGPPGADRTQVNTSVSEAFGAVFGSFGPHFGPHLKKEPAGGSSNQDCAPLG